MEQFFKVGDKVTCIVKGSGVVEEIVDNLTYPIIVRFCNSSFFKESYTYDGRFLNTGNITLLQGHVNLDEIIPKNKPIVNFTKGELVWVSDDGTEWVTGYFWYKTEDLFGTKGTNYTGISHWKHCRKFDDLPFPKQI